MTAATLSPRSSKIKFRLAGGAQPLILLPVQVNESGPFDFKVVIDYPGETLTLF
jgi:hypothetical protein